MNNQVPIAAGKGVLRSFTAVPSAELIRAVKKLAVHPREFCWRKAGQPWSSVRTVEELVARLHEAEEVALGISTTDYQQQLRIFRVLSLDQMQAALDIVCSAPGNELRWRLGQVHPLLPHLVFTRAGVEIQPRFMATVFVAFKGNVYYEFHLSEKIEPYVIIIAIDPHEGKLTWLSPLQVSHLEEAIASFKDRFVT